MHEKGSGSSDPTRQKSRSIRHQQRRERNGNLDWEGCGNVSTLPGLTVPLEIEQYLADLHSETTTPWKSDLEDRGIDLTQICVARLKAVGRLNIGAFEAQVDRLTRGGGKIAIIHTRLSGSRNQLEQGMSLPQQERVGVMAALREGATRLLVVSEVRSASGGAPRRAFEKLLRLAEKGLVDLWATAQVDRISRSVADGARWIDIMSKGRVRFIETNVDGTARRISKGDALTLTFKFLGAALHIFSLRGGGARTWKERMARGQWPNPGQLPLGFQLDIAGRPYISAKTRMALRRLAELVAAELPQHTLEGAVRVALEMLRVEMPDWWEVTESGTGSTKGVQITVRRALRVLHIKALLDGKQVVAFGDEDPVTVEYPSLAGTFSDQDFQKIYEASVADACRSRGRSSPWQSCFDELISLGHPLGLIIEEGRSALQLKPNGTYVVVCRECLRRGKDSHVVEIEPRYETLLLSDGTKRVSYRLPIFHCEDCGATIRPLSKNCLARLLSGTRRLRCPSCSHHVVRVWSPVKAVRWARALESEADCYYLCARCPMCRFEFSFPRTAVSLEAQLRRLNMARFRPRPENGRVDVRLEDFSTSLQDHVGQGGEHRD